MIEYVLISLGVSSPIFLFIGVVIYRFFKKELNTLMGLFEQKQLREIGIEFDKKFAEFKSLVELNSYKTEIIYDKQKDALTECIEQISSIILSIENSFDFDDFDFQLVCIEEYNLVNKCIAKNCLFISPVNWRIVDYFLSRLFAVTRNNTHDISDTISIFEYDILKYLQKKIISGFRFQLGIETARQEDIVTYLKPLVILKTNNIEPLPDSLKCVYTLCLANLDETIEYIIINKKTIKKDIEKMNKLTLTGFEIKYIEDCLKLF